MVLLHRVQKQRDNRRSNNEGMITMDYDSSVSFEFELFTFMELLYSNSTMLSCDVHNNGNDIAYMIHVL